jgi:hypothetical protein
VILGELATWRQTVQFVRKLVLSLVVTALILSYASFAFSAAYVSISSSGNGVFDLQGSGFNGVAGAKITIAYDTATLSNPRINQGGLMSGALMAVNTNSPGSIVLAMANTTGYTGSGSLATISFDLPGNSLGVIQSMTAELYSVAGIRIAAQSSVSNPFGTRTQDTTGQQSTASATTGDQQSTAQTAGQSASSTTSAGASAAGTSPNLVGGTVTMPGEGGTAKGEPKKGETAETGSAQKEAPAAAETGETGDKHVSDASPAVDADKKPESGPVTHLSVLERFRTFTGNKTGQALIAQFDNSDMKGVRQEPAVALSDGVTVVKIVISLPAGEKDAPNFAFRNAKYLSLKMAGENSWVVEVLPDKGSSSAAVKILSHGALTEVPLTIAPPLPAGIKIGTGGALTEADFTTFLKERGTDKTPRFDLNGDGKRDYIDDYIFTANYLVKRDSRKKATIKEQK